MCIPLTTHQASASYAVLQFAVAGRCRSGLGLRALQSRNGARNWPGPVAIVMPHGTCAQLLGSRRSDGHPDTRVSTAPALDQAAPRLRGGSARLLGALIGNGLRPQHFAAAIALVGELDLLAYEHRRDQAA